MLASLLTLLISVFFIVHTSFGAVVVQKSSSSGGSQAVSESGIVQVSAGGAQIAEIGPNKDVPAAFAGCGKGGSVSVIKDEGQIDAKINGVQYTNGPVISIGEAKKCIYHAGIVTENGADRTATSSEELAVRKYVRGETKAPPCSCECCR